MVQGVLGTSRWRVVLARLGVVLCASVSCHAETLSQAQCYADQAVLLRKLQATLAPHPHHLIPEHLRLKSQKQDLILAEPKDRPVHEPRLVACATIKDPCRRIKRDARKAGVHEVLRLSRFVCSVNERIHVSRVPNDPFFGDQSALDPTGTQVDIGAQSAWDTTTGSSSVVIGVIDTGIDYTHPALSGNIWTNPNEIAGNGIDDDHNGFIDDVHGINAITDSGDPMDDDGHGTHCAGIIGARGNDGVGVSGLNWNVKLIGAKFLDDTGNGSTLDAVKAMVYLTTLKSSRGINIVATNNSWGSISYLASLATAVQSAGTQGILVVAAAGNETSNNDVSPRYPASLAYNNVIAVSAVEEQGNLAYFSNYGPGTVQLAAPGNYILGPYLNHAYAYLSGTSEAAPHVTGAIGLLAAYRPTSSMAGRKEAVLGSVRRSSALNGVVSTGGLLNLPQMLAYQMATPAPTVTPTVPVATATPTPRTTAGATPTRSASGGGGGGSIDPGPTPTPSNLLAAPGLRASGSSLRVSLPRIDGATFTVIGEKRVLGKKTIRKTATTASRATYLRPLAKGRWYVRYRAAVSGQAARYSREVATTIR